MVLPGRLTWAKSKNSEEGNVLIEATGFPQINCLIQICEPHKEKSSVTNSKIRLEKLERLKIADIGHKVHMLKLIKDKKEKIKTLNIIS